jgi:hypothetical protein
VPFLPLGYGRLTCTLYLCPVFGEYYILRLYLESNDIKLSDNTLHYYIKTCVDKGILKTAIYKLADTFREFRNIVHLAKEESPRHTISRPTAKSAVASIFTIANDFEKST